MSDNNAACKTLLMQLFVKAMSILHRVPEKHVTTFSTITLTISVRLQ